jgi:hypothetical protein
MVDEESAGGGARYLTLQYPEIDDPSQFAWTGEIVGQKRNSLHHNTEARSIALQVQPVQTNSSVHPPNDSSLGSSFANWMSSPSHQRLQIVPDFFAQSEDEDV